MFQSTPLCEGRHLAMKWLIDALGVSIHAPVRGATMGLKIVTDWIKFQSTPLCEGRQISGIARLCRREFQSTPLCEGRHPTKRVMAPITCFNPRPCARGDERDAGVHQLHFRFQSTPLCEGRRKKHAMRMRDVGFQSTPLCEGRRVTSCCPPCWICFNPRPCARGDLLYSSPSSPLHVSIHAPVRGATGYLCKRIDPGTVSIHAPVRGATFPGEWCIAGWCSFNPRPCARGDIPSPPPLPARPVSIHAPVRGATSVRIVVIVRVAVSIHAPVRGATYMMSREISTIGVSIHAPVRGATCLCPELAVVERVSIHAPVRGATLRFAPLLAHLSEFQSTPLCEGRPVSAFAVAAFCSVSIHAPVRGATCLNPWFS